MTLRVTNTLSGEREPFEPIDEDTVLLYLCGLTTSDPAHLGHARTWVHTDVMHRWLAHLGYDVRHVENFTDVNEKIVARVGEVGDDEESVAEHYIDEFLEVMRALNLKRVDVYPRVTEHVPEIVDLVETLVEGGYAYESNGSVYFDVTSFEDYGALSNQALEGMEAQGQDDELADKRHPEDFALWKAGGVSPGEIEEHRHDAAAPAGAACETAMTFDSPWGEGRPGWHIECSAMSMTHLGETFDVHVAGRDLVFPHNENEVAQSEAATGKRFARYWLHTGMLRTGGEEGDAEKMSSSLLNYYEASEAVEAFGADVLRTFYCSTVYSADQSFTEAALAEAEERYDRLARSHERAVAAADSVDAHTKVEDAALRATVAETREGFRAAMNDDFNTREALAALLDLATAVNSHVDDHDEYDYRALADAVDAFETLGGGVLGLTLGTDDAGGEVDIVDDLVELVLEVREEERAAGNYDRGDELRARLQALGVEVQDTDDGPTYRR